MKTKMSSGKNLLKKASYTMAIAIVGAIVGISLQAVKAWSEPTDAPPTSNIGAPINTGATPQTKYSSIAINNDWFRNNGAAGWYSNTYGGGLYMSDISWIQIYGGKSFYAGSGAIRTDGQFQVGNNGANFLVTSSGSVGIGTTSPGQTIELVRDDTDAAIRFHDPGNAWYTMGVDVSDGRKFKLNYGPDAGSANHFTMDTAGNVGIGTTAPSTNSKLNINGGHLNLGGASDPSASQGNNWITWGDRADGNPYYAIRTAVTSTPTSHNRLQIGWHTGIQIGAHPVYGGTRFYDNSPFTGNEIFSVGSGDSNVRVANSLYVTGNIGIGTSTPAAKMDISYASNTNYALKVYNGGGSALGVEISGGANAASPLLNVHSGYSGGDRQALWVQSNGNVGMGTTTPTQKLDVAGNIKGTQLCIADDCRSAWPASSASQWIASGSNIYYNAGNVAIGTTPSGYRLDVAGDIRAQSAWLRNTGAAGWYNETYGGGMYMNDTSWVKVYNNKGFYAGAGIIRTDGELQVGSGGATFLVNSSGNVGIGTTAPSGSLHVKNNGGSQTSVFESSSSGNISQLRLVNGVGSNWDMVGWGSSFGGRFSIRNNAGTEALAITQSGNVGIGTTTPLGIFTVKAKTNQNLHVMTDANGSDTNSVGIASINDANSAYQPITYMASRHTFSVGNVGIGTNNPLSKLSIGTVGAAGVTVDVNASGSTAIRGTGTNTGVNGVGVFGVSASGSNYDFYAMGGGADYGSASSIRWKSNVSDIDNALDKVLKMRGVYYDWDQDHGGKKHDMGFIAEEVGAQIPEVVVWDKDAPGYATGMDYGHVTPLLVEAIKEQQKQIEDEKGKNIQMQQQIDELKNQIQWLTNSSSGQ